MALTPFQRHVCQLLAKNRIRIGESYVAGGAALNFHDTEEALAASWRMDRESLEGDGLAVSVIRERPTFVEAGIARGGDSVVVQWAQDSAYRFFPFLAWAACGKDPGFSPSTILEQAARSSRYSEAELAGLDFEGEAPSAAELSRQWHVALAAAREVVTLLPPVEAGRAVLTTSGVPYRGDPAALRADLAGRGLGYHEGSIRGAFPRIVR